MKKVICLVFCVMLIFTSCSYFAPKADVLLSKGISRDNLETVKRAVEMGANLEKTTWNMPTSLHEKDYSPLSQAIAKNDFALTSVFLDAGAEPNISGNNGMTLLMAAAYDYANLDICGELILHGADCSAISGGELSGMYASDILLLKYNFDEPELCYTVLKSMYENGAKITDKTLDVIFGSMNHLKLYDMLFRLVNESSGSDVFLELSELWKAVLKLDIEEICLTLDNGALSEENYSRIFDYIAANGTVQDLQSFLLKLPKGLSLLKNGGRFINSASQCNSLEMVKFIVENSECDDLQEWSPALLNPDNQIYAYLAESRVLRPKDVSVEDICRTDNTEILKLLSVSDDELNNQRNELLLSAVKYNSIKVLDLLLEKKISFEDVEFELPYYDILSAACYNKDIKLDIVSRILKAGIPPDGCVYKGYPLSYAIKNQRGDIVQCLLDNGAALNEKLVYQDGGHVDPPIFLAVQTGHDDILRLLIDNKADINIKDCQGNTPLINAYYAGNTKLFKTLVSAGADPSVSGSGKMNIFDIARQEPEFWDLIKDLQ